MTARLRRAEIAHHLAALQQHSSLTALQSARLMAILDTLADDGRSVLRAALDAAEFPAGDARGQEAFQDFRKRVNRAAAEAGVDLRLELDSRKAPPDLGRNGFGIDGIRADRILHEALTAGPDPLHLALMFNIEHSTALCYATVAEHLLSDELEAAAATETGPNR